MADSDSDNHIFFSSPVFVTLIPLSNKATIGFAGHNSVKSGVRRHSSVNFLAFSYPHHPTWSWLLVPSLSCILTIIQHWASRSFLPTSMSNCDLYAPSNGVFFTNETVYELWNARVWLAETALEDNSLNFWTRFLRKWTRQRAVLTDRSTLRRSMIQVYIFEISMKFCVDWYIIWYILKRFENSCFIQVATTTGAVWEACCSR